jgi:regulatory protein
MTPLPENRAGAAVPDGAAGERPGPSAVRVTRFEDLRAGSSVPAAVARLDDPDPVAGAPSVSVPVDLLRLAEGTRAARAARLDDADLGAGADPARVADLDISGPAGRGGPASVVSLDGVAEIDDRRTVRRRAVTGGSAARSRPDRDAPAPAREPDRRSRSGGAATGAGSRVGRERGQQDEQGRQDRPVEDADPESVARAICLRLLTDRARTRQELAQALRRKGVPADVAEAVLERFGDVGLIDDTAFAGQWVRSRHEVRGLGRRALAVELRRKGVSEDVAGEALAEVDADAESRRARALVDRRLRSLPTETEKQRAGAARRLVGMLARKGYAAGTAYRVVREALADHGAVPDGLDAAPPED